MKFFLKIIFVFFITLTFYNCPTSVEGSGKVEERSYAITDFTDVEISTAFEATITRGDTFSVKVRVDDNLFNSVEVIQDGTLLKIRIKEGEYITNVTELKAIIVMPSLTKISANTASKVDFSNFVIPNFTVNVKSKSTCTDNSCDIGNATITVDTLSTLNLKNSKVDNATVDIADASTVNIGMADNGTLKGRISGASTLNYYGNPLPLEVTKVDVASSINHK